MALNAVFVFITDTMLDLIVAVASLSYVIDQNLLGRVSTFSAFSWRLTEFADQVTIFFVWT